MGLTYWAPCAQPPASISNAKRACSDGSSVGQVGQVLHRHYRIRQYKK